MSSGDPPPIGLPAGYRLHFFETLDSTNDQARRLAEAGEDEGALVWALTQTAGRGRRGRIWRSLPGNLHLSYLVRPAEPLAATSQLSLVAGTALVRAIAAHAPELAGRVTLKWPNDVMLEERKLAGILLESGQAAGRRPADWLVVGIGLNSASAPVDAGIEAAALGLPPGGDALARIVESLTAFWDEELKGWRRQGFADVRARWLARAAYLGRTVTATLAERELTGIFEGLDDDGALILKEASGITHRIVAGEVARTRTGAPGP